MKINLRDIFHVADIFQALVQDRPCSKGLRQGEILTILGKYVKRESIDREIVELVHDNPNDCFGIASRHGALHGCSGASA